MERGHELGCGPSSVSFAHPGCGRKSGDTVSPGVSAARRQEGSVPCCVAGWLWIPALEFVFAGEW